MYLVTDTTTKRDKTLVPPLCHASKYIIIETFALNQSRPLTDLQLITALCSEQDDNDLYTEFVNRFHKELNSECANICKKRKLDLHIGKQVCHDVFEKLRRYKSFKVDEIKIASAHNAILVYLFRIARNLFSDWHNKERRLKEPYVGRNYFDDLYDSVQSAENGERLYQIKDIAVKMFDKLNHKEKEVILADIDHKKQQCYLPDDITEMLSEKLGVQKTTIRKIRERGINKIKKAIDEINQQ